MTNKSCGTKYLDLTKCSVFIFYIKDILVSPAAGKESANSLETERSPGSLQYESSRGPKGAMWRRKYTGLILWKHVHDM